MRLDVPGPAPRGQGDRARIVEPVADRNPPGRRTLAQGLRNRGPVEVGRQALDFPVPLVGVPCADVERGVDHGLSGGGIVLIAGVAVAAAGVGDALVDVVCLAVDAVGVYLEQYG